MFARGNGAFRPRTLAAWRWEFGDAALVRTIVVAEAGDGRLIAHYGAIPLRWQVDGEEVVACHVVDSMVRPEWCGRLKREGPFLAAARAYFAEREGHARCWCSYGFPTPCAGETMDWAVRHAGRKGDARRTT